MSTPKKIIVTGVTGQDGSYMVDYLLAHTEHQVYGMIRHTAKPDHSNLAAALGHPRFQLVIGDLTDGQSIEQLVRTIQPSYFINLAAQSFVGASWEIPEATFDIDATAIIRCLEAIRKHAPHCRFYNAGSSEELGDVVYSPQDEKHPARARSVYGAAKIAARQLVKVYRESYGLYAVQGLLFNHESERRGESFVTRKITRGIARIARAIKDGKPFEPIELGNLDAKRDWSHAEDFVDGIWRMLNQEVYRQPVLQQLYSRHQTTEQPLHQFDIKEYILSSGETHTVREFVERAFEAARLEGWWYGNYKDEAFKWHYYLPKRSDDPDNWYTLVRINPAFYRLADVELLIGDSTPARQELGWSPRVSFGELVNRMVVNDLREQGIDAI